MTKIFVTSDLHFGHANVLKFCPETRGMFATADEMNSGMIEQWNKTVSPEDTAYILGDVAFTSATEACKILAQLNGTKILIEGNHDYKNLRDRMFRSQFAEIHKLYELVHNKNRIVMCHYPLASWNQCHRGAIMLHGHLHGKPSGLEQYRIKDVGYDSTGKVVSLLDDIISEISSNEINPR